MGVGAGLDGPEIPPSSVVGSPDRPARSVVVIPTSYPGRLNI